jgi:hypothetical protein
MSSLHTIDGELPEALDTIKAVTETQEAVMSFYYTDAANQVTLSPYKTIDKVTKCSRGLFLETAGDFFHRF